MKAVLYALPLLFASAASAEFYTKTTDQFGIVATDIGPAFRVSAVCTVSAGEIEDAADKAAWIPQVGEKLAKVVDAASLDKGVAGCGLRHSEKAGLNADPAETDGFGLDVRSYKDGKVIGNVQPKFMCNKRPVNVFGVCFEVIKLKENENKSEADGVTACIDIHATATTKAKSVVLGAGKIADAVKEAMKTEGAAVSDAPCSARTY